MSAIKACAITEEQARALYGTLVDDVLAKNCDFTSRIIDDEDVVEFSACVDFVDADGIDRKLVVLYLEDSDAVNDTEDLGTLSWDRYTFEVI